MNKETKYPKIVTFYLKWFATFKWTAAGVIAIGIILTICGVNPAIPTYIVCGAFILVAPVHVTVWILKRRVDLK
jgi:hypothetical protein